MAPFTEYLRPILKSLRSDDDSFDRLNHRYSAAVLLVFALLTTMKQYVGEPILCWVPGRFTGAMEDYTNAMCWISNTYWVPFETRIPNPDDPKPHIAYYQWVPIVLLLQALLFKLPCVAWRLLSYNSGIDIQAMFKKLERDEIIEHKKMKSNVKEVTRYLARYLDATRDQPHGCCAWARRIMSSYLCVCVGKRRGNYLYMLFLWIKILYMVNGLGQMFLLNAFLGTQFTMYGYQIIEDLINWRDWTETGRFPRTTLCDIKIRELGGNIHRHTIQCGLPINFFNERIYMFLWFWLVFVSAGTIFGFFTWMSLFSVNERKVFVKKTISMTGKGDSIEQNRDTKRLKNFVTKYLRMDGVFVLKLLAKNTSDVVISRVVYSLWKRYLKRHKELQPDGLPLTPKANDASSPSAPPTDADDSEPPKGL
ncbi:innexin unc-9 [Lingula anatina]|nr:innexin unc-9-like [Lingula anatina]XP_013379282.1 innexin unc-9 [Lingula anatina]XP_023930288.1 innexin unc-9 [Lingula anatina]|eukprot:XP_013379272.1 innexin unc-9-like [Lingula anatina]